MIGSATDVETFRAAVSERLGLSLEGLGDTALAAVLQRRLEATRRSAAQYVADFAGSAPAAEIAAVAAEVTVPETYFFRHQAQFEAFAQVAVPVALGARAADGSRAVRVLSAGCASGEEAYSLVMLLQDLRPDDSWQTTVLAVDASGAALDRARAARYSSWSLRETSEHMRRRFFRTDGRDVTLVDSVRRGVHFAHANLADPRSSLWQCEQFDVIFCRNVLMYMTPEAMAATVDRLARVLRPGGFLFVGHAESLRGTTTALELCQSGGAFYYRRPRAGSHAPALSGSHRAEPVTGWWQAIDQASDRIRRLAPPPAGGTPRQGAVPTPPAASPAMNEALELLDAERFDDALAALEAGPGAGDDPRAQLVRAVLLVQRGAVDEAADTCGVLLASGRLQAEAHHVLALCEEAKGDFAGAIGHDRAAMHIDPRFAMARLHAGLVAQRTGDLELARRELREAIDLLRVDDGGNIRLFGGGFGRLALVEMCRSLLEGGERA